MNLNRRLPLLRANHPPASHQLQGNLAVQLSWPTNRELHPLPRQQVLVRDEQNAIAAHVDGLPRAGLVNVLPVEDLVADLPLDGEAILSATIVLVFFLFHTG